ncbi:MAG: hypothetical protein K9N00_01905 [Candidatus Marinimicrobia bacterium]|nr:hypothetical protein [Candidatus Neomarinimicrobiota bacterium]
MNDYFGDIYIANVGKRDLTYNSQLVRPPRITGRDYLERFNELKDKLEFPIITKGLDKVLQGSSQKSIKNLYLFYTDQNKDEVDERHWESDTIYFAKIIKKLIQERRSQQIEKIIPIPIQAAPNDYSTMFDFFADQLEKIKSNPNFKVRNAYLAPAGGTPACNMSLVIYGTRIFANWAKTLLIPENKNKKAREIDLSNSIIHEFNQTVVEEMLNYNFSGAAEVMKREGSWKNLVKLAQYMQYRLYFDMEKAEKLISQVKSNRIKLPPDLQSEYENTGDLIQELKESVSIFNQEYTPLYKGLDEKACKTWLDMQKKRIVELSLNIRMKWFSRQYVDMLGRIFRLQEAILRYVFENETGYSADSGKNYDDFYTYLGNEGKEFDRYLTVNLKKSKPNSRAYNKSLNSKTLYWFLKYLHDEKGRNDLSDILNLINKLRQLRDLRNKSIVSHGYKPVSREKIRQIYGKRKLVKSMQNISSYFGLQDRYDQVEYIKKLILFNYRR